MPTHGTHSAYSNGCRCDDCRTAHRDYTAARRRAAIESDTLTHGASSTYDAGCRCAHCCDARRVKYYTAPAEYPAVNASTWRART